MNARRNAPCRPVIHLIAAAIGYANTAGSAVGYHAGSTALGDNSIEKSAGMGVGIDLQRRLGDVQ